jgi:nicotinamide-nucleotide amidase
MGPTEDDRTRQAVAQAVDRLVERDEERVQRLRAQFESRGRRFQPFQARQADRPLGADWIDNPLGTAAGFVLQDRDRQLFALPGVPAELKAMFHAAVLPRIRESSAPIAVATRTLKVAGRTEPSVDEQLRDLYGGHGVEVTILAATEGIELHLRAAGEEAEASVADLDRRMTTRLGLDLYGRDDETLPAVVGALLARKGRTVATAESCTAGLLAATLTGVAGASGWFRGGWVVYSDALKRELAGVADELLTRHGAVSEAVARELAVEVRRRCATDFGIGITGIAGPGGGTPEKPVGLVHSALATDAMVLHWRTLHFGDRELVRRRTVTAALDRLRRVLVGEAGV